MNSAKLKDTKSAYKNELHFCILTMNHPKKKKKKWKEDTFPIA